ncbi:MAG TPA: hypothetical protein VMZ26_00570 [Pyrinomonadaceae bacterium]|nr:hypothetical protein [Pyrinomonadaceae bacterium]
MKNLFCLLLGLCLTVGFAVGTFGQVKPPKVLKDPKPKIYPVPPGHETPGFLDGDGETSEKSTMVDASVAITLCVAQGDLRINGWHRNEVRVFVKNGRQFKMKPREKSPETGKVNWLWIGNVVEGRPAPLAQCLAGEHIEIDAPVGSTFDLEAAAARTSVDSVKKIKVKTRTGIISLRNIPGGIDAYTAQGDVIVENSGGAIEIESTTGNIVAVEVSSGQIGDLFSARTNSGTISLQRVDHRQIKASSISGSLLFDGKFLEGGIYTFRTSNGSIMLAIPAISSCTFTTTYGEGAFHSEIPLKTVTENITPRAKIVVSRLGKGDATVNLTTSNGSIGIRKQASP